MEKILEIAKQLGEALAEHPIGKRYNEAREALDADPAAKQLIQDYEKSAMQLSQKEQQGRPIEPEDKRKMASLQSQLAGNLAVKQWLQSQVDYMDLLRQVNEQVLKPGPSVISK
jgi:cell fate (sporulation/competence/biofilm development) regulator YlbF (YheA/YmcA/DUF963 family)